MLEVRVAAGCGPTGRVLERLIREAGGGQKAGRGLVSWGVRLEGANVLNGNAGRYDKYGQLQRLEEMHVPCLQTTRVAPRDQASYPWIARQAHHVAGRDIRLCLQPEDAEFALRHGHDFLTKFVPRAKEYRVWVYRRRHLGSYEKVLTHPERYKKFGCNYRNGWAFNLLNEAAIPRAAVELAGRAVDALGLDFGAADILVPKVGEPLILEVNTAPGVEGDGRQVIRALARRIVGWETHGFLRRNGDKREVA
jgi:hypothetical protein